MKRFAFVTGGLTAAGIAALCAVSRVAADNTDTESVSVSGTLVSSLDATVQSNLTMPHVVRPNPVENTNATVSLSCGPTDATNLVTYGGNGNPYAHGTAAAPAANSNSANRLAAPANATGRCAQILVHGEANYYFIQTYPNTAGAMPTGVTFQGINCTNGNGSSVQLDGSGNATIRCGGTTSVSKTNTVSSYSGSFTFTVTYD